MFDPISMALTAASVGLSLFGSSKVRSGEKAQAQAQQAIIAEQQKAEALRRQQMELEAKRRNTETLRNQQRARSMALTAATNQGAATGSGLQGGYGQIGGQAGSQLTATSQNLQIGRGLFDINQSISGYNAAYAAAGSTISSGRGWQQLGASISSSTPQLTSLFKGFGNTGGRGVSTYTGITGSNPYMSSNMSYWV